MADNWTRQELEKLHPFGYVGVQVDDDFTPLTEEEWSAWIDSQVGLPKESEMPPQ